MAKKTVPSDGNKRPPAHGEGGRFARGGGGGPGRPKGSVSVTTTLRHVMEEKADYSAEKVAEAALKLAIGGDMRAIEYITDRIDGKVTQRVDMNIVQAEAERLAKEYGLDVDDVLAEAQSLLEEKR